MFFFPAKSEICKLADDNSFYSCGMNLECIVSNLINNMENRYEWFAYHSMKANPDKFRFIILGNTALLTLQINDITIKST